MSNIESRNVPSKARTESYRDQEKTYRGKVSGDVLSVWVDELDVGTVGDASVNQTSTRELFRCPVEPENLYSFEPDDELIACYEAGLPQLALILLSDAMGPEVGRARQQSFLYQVVNRLPKVWSLTLGQIREFLDVGILPPCVD